MERRKQPTLGFAARETAPGAYKFQAVVFVASRNGENMTKTMYPHAHLLPESRVAGLGYATRSIIEKVQAQRETVPGSEGERRRTGILQLTLAGIDEREHKQLQEDIAYAEEMIRAMSYFGERYGDPDTMFQGVYPNVTDQYRDFDVDPDRYANLFIRDADYRLSQHQTRPERRAEHKQERQERRRERNRKSRVIRRPNIISWQDLW